LESSTFLLLKFPVWFWLGPVRITKEEVLEKYVVNMLPNVGRILLETLASNKKSAGIQVSGETTNVIFNISPIKTKNEVAGMLGAFQQNPSGHDGYY